jgi:hypothetical protein
MRCSAPRPRVKTENRDLSAAPTCYGTNDQTGALDRVSGGSPTSCPCVVSQVPCDAGPVHVKR